MIEQMSNVHSAALQDDNNYIHSQLRNEHWNTGREKEDVLTESLSAKIN